MATGPEYEAKRLEKVKEVAEFFRGKSIEEIASRTVGMLIMDEGNLNRYQASLEFMLEALNQPSTEPVAAQGTSQ